MTETIDAGWPNPNRNSFKVPFEMARRSLAEERGADLRYAEFMGADEEFAALRAGEIDVGFATAPQVVRLVEEGVDLRLAVGFLQGQTFRLLARAEVDGPADLAGRRVSYQPGGGISEQALRYTAAEADLVPGEDFELVEILPIPEIRTALVEGRIDAAPLGVDTALHVIREESEPFHVIGDEALRARPPEYVVGWVTTGSILADREPLVAAYRDAMVRGYERAYGTDVEELARIARSMKYLGDLHLDDLAESLRIYVDSDVWPRDGTVPAATWERTVERLGEIGLIDGDIPPALPAPV